MPVPVKLTVAGELVALLDMETLPFALPAVVGANVTFSVAVWLGVSVVPALTPLAMNPVPVTVTLEIVTFELPVLVTGTDCELLWLTVTLPKLRLVGLALRLKVAATPAPLRPTEVGEVGSLLTMLMLPEAAPVDVGWKAAVIAVCCPALTFNGSKNPLTMNPVPDAVTCIMVNVAVPVFFTITA